MKIIKDKNYIKELLRFVFTGGISFLIDYSTMVVFKEIIGVDYLLASIIGFTVSVIVNYFMCILWVFENANKGDKKTVIVFVGSSVIGLGLTALLMWVFVDLLGLFYMIAKVIVTAIVMVWNYFAKKKAVQL